MLLIIILFIGLAVLSALLSNEKTPSAMDEYCKLECQECKVRDKSICC